MMKNNAIKVLAVIFGPFLALLVLIYFVYPQINEEKYNQVIDEFRDSDEFEPELYDPAPRIASTQSVGSLPNQLDLLMGEQLSLQNIIDSLQTEKELLLSEIQELHEQRDAVLAQLDGGQAQPVNDTVQAGLQMADATAGANEEFSERVKSLLNLDEEELAPIVRQLSNEQLVRLYYSAGNIQREKLLRSLSADRAAILMEKIML